MHHKQPQAETHTLSLTGLKGKLTRLKEQVEAKSWTIPQSIIYLLRNTHQKSYVINFPTQVCSSQSEEQMMFFTCKKSNISNQNCKQCFFFHVEKNDTSNQKPHWFMSFMPNFPPFIGASSL